jgi:hypothetical protein
LPDAHTTRRTRLSLKMRQFEDQDMTLEPRFSRLAGPEGGRRSEVGLPRGVRKGKANPDGRMDQSPPGVNMSKPPLHWRFPTTSGTGQGSISCQLNLVDRYCGADTRISINHTRMSSGDLQICMYCMCGRIVPRLYLKRLYGLIQSSHGLALIEAICSKATKTTEKLI